MKFMTCLTVVAFGVLFVACGANQEGQYVPARRQEKVKAGCCSSLMKMFGCKDNCVKPQQRTPSPTMNVIVGPIPTDIANGQTHDQTIIGDKMDQVLANVGDGIADGIENAIEFVQDLTRGPPVIRREIRQLPERDQMRFVNAVKHMMKSKNGVPGTSDYFNVAKLHGGPGDADSVFCAHGVETFPLWHRLLLSQFEKALQKADKELGNDGRIALPYWDWIDHIEYQGQVLPNVARQFLNELPNDMLPNGEILPLQRYSDAFIKQAVEQSQAIQDAKESLLASEHYKFASTGHEKASAYPACELSHNLIHGIVGQTMGSVARSAFDPMFWLHHANVDRLDQSYLNSETDAMNEMAAYQSVQSENLFEQPLKPFRKPNGEWYYPKDVFNTESFGYVYDELVYHPQLEDQRGDRDYIVFDPVKIIQFDGKNYQIHAFLISPIEFPFWNKPESLSEILNNPNWAGMYPIFGRDQTCETCSKRKEFIIKIDVTDALKRLKLTPFYSVIKMIAVRTDLDVPTVIDIKDELPFLSDPEIESPPSEAAKFFADMYDDLEKLNDKFDAKMDEAADDFKEKWKLFIATQQPTDEQLEEFDFKQKWESAKRSIVKFFKRFGYYVDKANDKFDEWMTEMILTSQGIYGVNQDGKIGPETWQAFNKKRCGNKDLNDELLEKQQIWLKEMLTNGVTQLKYHVYPSPGYLYRPTVMQDIEDSFQHWSEKLGNKITFICVNNKTEDELQNIRSAKPTQSYDIEIRWIGDEHDAYQTLRFDGIGGAYGTAGKLASRITPGIYLDRSERWANGRADTDPYLSMEQSLPEMFRPKTQLVRVRAVLVHLIGHLLGLQHSHDTHDVMSPVYDQFRNVLTENDVVAANQEYVKLTAPQYQ